MGREDITDPDGWRIRLRLAAAVLSVAAVIPGASAAQASSAEAPSTQYGFVTFPEDESQHIDGWNYWWGAANLVTKSGHRYTVGVAFDSFYGVGVAGHQIFPRQGPYKGLSVTSMDGPGEWGHPGDFAGRYLSDVSHARPGKLLRFETHDILDGLKTIGLWERTSATKERYHLRIDNSEAKVHPSNQRVEAVLDLDANMQSPPLLLGGTGQWWYGIPQTYDYPSRSYQYMQAAKRMSGTLRLEQPDGSILEETIAPRKSNMVMVREYDATPEDLFLGLALAEATQIHPRYAQYYHGGMPWDLIAVDLGNGAQLMFAALAFHETNKGTLTQLVGPDQPTYQVLATLRLPDGRSVALDDELHVEHLNYRRLVGRVPTFQISLTAIWKQAWDFRVSYPGGKLRAGDGSRVKVPPFDLGLLPQFNTSEPAPDDRGNRMTQRVPFIARGHYDGCAVRGFGWSELIVNWYGHENEDPWFTGGDPPVVPDGCSDDLPTPPSGTPGDLDPDFGPPPAPNLKPEGCMAFNPGTPMCEYTATIDGAVGATGLNPGGWKVTITRPGEPEPIVIDSFSGYEMYACGTIHPGDHVIATAEPGSGVFAGNPGLCF